MEGEAMSGKAVKSSNSIRGPGTGVDEDLLGRAGFRTRGTKAGRFGPLPMIGMTRVEEEERSEKRRDVEGCGVREFGVLVCEWGERETGNTWRLGWMMRCFVDFEFGGDF